MTVNSHSTRLNPVILNLLFLFGLSIALSKSASNVSIALVYLLSLFFTYFNREFRQAIAGSWKQPLLAPIAFYLLVAVAGIFYSEYTRDGIGIVDKFSGLLLVYFMMSALLDMLDDKESRQRSYQLLSVFLIGIFALDVVGILTYFGIVGHQKFMLPVWPLHVRHIWYANLNAVGLYTAVGLLLYSGYRRLPLGRLLLALFVLVALASLFLSLSRTAWFSMIVTSVVLVAVSTSRKKIFFISVAAFLSAGLLLYLFNSTIHNRLNTIATDLAKFSSGNANTNIGARLLLWQAAFRMFLSNPVFGLGTGDFVITLKGLVASGDYPLFLADFNQPHNIYLFALSTTGLIGLSAVLFIFYRGLTVSLPAMKSEENRLFGFVATATLVHYMVGGLADSFFNIQMLRYTFAFVLGICIRRGLLDRKSDAAGKEETTAAVVSSPGL